MNPKQATFILRAKRLRDNLQERMRVLDSTIYRNITSQELRRERRKVREEMITQTELEVDLLRAELGLAQIK